MFSAGKQSKTTVPLGGQSRASLLKYLILTAKPLIVTDAPNSREYCGVRAYSKFY